MKDIVMLKTGEVNYMNISTGIREKFHNTLKNHETFLLIQFVIIL